METVKHGALGTMSDSFPAVMPLDGWEAVVPLKRYVANNFVIEVDVARGSTARTVCNTKAKLVEQKLEMVRADGLLDCGTAVSGVRRINTGDRLQCNEID